MRGGSTGDMTSTCVQGSLPRPLSGYQPNMIEPRSPTSAWQYRHPIIPKQEPMDEDRNDSGINSGSDFHSSPGSEHSHEMNTPYSPPAAYYATPVMPRINSAPAVYQTNVAMHMLYHHNPLTPPSSEPMASPTGHGNISNEKDVDTTLTPCPSPHSQNKSVDGSSDNEDPLRRLQMTLEKNGLLPPAPSPKTSEHSGDDDSKSDNDPEEYDEQGLRIPKVNSHGKVKTFKCKQCEFVAITKLDFWEHTKGHIKADKLLTCPKCPFVTEYKHHLEYHLRNHFGSKPFKCDKCSYSCVNKSMLNSHLKSHSNIYQYRCSDCSYATKYCHSLKLHLRKYNHKPAMVLNPDGTPNPLPIIDVYGTRRGPKVKNHSPSSEDNANSPQPEQMLPYGLPQFMLNTPPQMQLPFPYPFLGGFPGHIPNPLLFQQMERLAKERQNSMSTEEDPSESRNSTPEPPASESGALDLSKPDPTEQPIKNRRKGRAFKISTTQVNSSDDDEDDEEVDNNTTTMFSNVEVGIKEEERMDDKESTNDKEANNNKPDDNFSCQYCNIAFGDPVLYTMHMGYHGYNNPFTCNMCGEECKDKVSFFLHIARTSHS